jgi:hypothetical protein
VNGVEKDRRREACQEPEPLGQVFSAPLAPGIEIDLDREESAPKTHPQAQNEDERFSLEQGAQGIERNHHEGDSRGVEGIPAVRLGAGNDMGSGPALEHHEAGVIPLLVVVRQVEVPVAEQAVADDEIVGFIPAESDSAGNLEK